MLGALQAFAKRHRRVKDKVLEELATREIAKVRWALPSASNSDVIDDLISFDFDHKKAIEKRIVDQQSSNCYPRAEATVSGSIDVEPICSPSRVCDWNWQRQSLPDVAVSDKTLRSTFRQAVAESKARKTHNVGARTVELLRAAHVDGAA